MSQMQYHRSIWLYLIWVDLELRLELEMRYQTTPKKRIEVVKVTVGEITKEFQVECCSPKEIRPNRYKFAVRVKQSGMWSFLSFIEQASFTKAAEQAFHLHY